jgi:hypothetical protein
MALYADARSGVRHQYNRKAEWKGLVSARDKSHEYVAPGFRSRGRKWRRREILDGQRLGRRARRDVQLPGTPVRRPEFARDPSIVDIAIDDTEIWTSPEHRQEQPDHEQRNEGTEGNTATHRRIIGPRRQPWLVSRARPAGRLGSTRCDRVAAKDEPDRP